MQESTLKRAVFFWSWNGELTEEEIRRQIGDFAEKGFAGFFLCSRMGLKCYYMGEEWFRFCRVAVEEAGKHGMRVWLYDEDGWPSGMAGGEMSRYPAEAVTSLLPVYDRNIVAAAEEDIFAAFRYTDRGSVPCPTGETPDWAMVLHRDPGYVNLLDSSATRHFLELSYERYRKELGKEFGSVVPGMFTDEPQLTKKGYPWSGEMPRLLEERWGENWLEKLPLLEEEGEERPAFRHTYWQAVGDLFAAAYTHQIADWCEENGLLFTGHFPCEDGLCEQLRVTGGVMQHYRYMHIPGIDYLGRRHASAVLLRQVSSVANQLGRQDVLCETFGASGWQVTFGELGWNWGRQVALGINLPCLHLAAYSIAGARKKDHPVFFSEQEPWWRDFSAFLTWMNGLSAFSMQGAGTQDVLLLSPMSGMRCAASGEGYNEESQCLSAAFRTAVETLGDIQVRFDIGDDSLLAEYGCVREGRLWVGQVAYSTVLVAETTSLTNPVWLLLQAFCRAGGELVFLNRRPQWVEGRSEAGLLALSGTIVPLRRDRLRRYFTEKRYHRPVRVMDADTHALAENFCLRITRTDTGWHLVLCAEQPMAAERRIRLELNGMYRLFSLSADFSRREEWPVFVCGEGVACVCTVYPGQVLILEAERGNAPRVKPLKLFCAQRLTEWTVATEENCLVIDRAAWRTGTVPFGEVLPMEEVLDALYRSGCPQAEVRYRFCLGEEPENYPSLRAVIEAGAESFCVNGQRVEQPARDSWIDPDFREYDIRSLLGRGENTIDIRYRGFCSTAVPLEDTFESATNRFSYPVEPAAVYIRGSFVTQPLGGWTELGDHYRVNAPFCLEPLRETAVFGELTRQGYWFYRGNVRYRTYFVWNGEKERVSLHISGLRGTAVRLRVNGEDGGLMWMAPYRTDITDWLKPGENELELELLGNNRNLLGPHHHKSGTSRVVGRDTFAGKPGWEDFAQPELRQGEPVWTDSYTVVPLSLGTVYIEQYRED